VCCKAILKYPRQENSPKKVVFEFLWVKGMNFMPIVALGRATFAALAVTLLAACSVSSAIAPQQTSPRNNPYTTTKRVPSPNIILRGHNFSSRIYHHFNSFDNCPATGQLEYISDELVINIFAGTFVGQRPCGQIASGVDGPIGLFVEHTTGDLYVANTAGYDVLVFHRGQTSAYNVYRDPNFNDLPPADVAVTSTGIVITFSSYFSTWIEGPNGGTFVGDYPVCACYGGGFLAVQSADTVYFDDVGCPELSCGGDVMSMSCPAGVCGAQTNVIDNLWFPWGMAFDPTGKLAVILSGPDVPSTADIFQLPDPNPKTVSLGCWYPQACGGYSLPYGVAFSRAVPEKSMTIFMTDPYKNIATEYYYPSFKLIGRVPGNPGGFMVGIAVDS
jgi:hypothetical protein